MNKIFLFCIFLLFIECTVKQDCSCDELREGKFESYEEGEKVGIFYRKGNFQLERDIYSDSIKIVRIKPNNCNYLMNSYKINDTFDTITWSLNYKKIKKRTYSFTMTPTYLKTSFSVKGSTVKVSSKIESKKVLELFEKLQK